MTIKRIAVIGAGGHATVVASTIIASGNEVVGFYADDPPSWGSTILDIPVLGPISEVSSSHCSHAIIAIGSNEARKRIAAEIDIDWITVVHPFTSVHPGVPIGKGTVICAGAIIQPGSQIGSHVIINTKASIDHHCKVGDYAHVATAHMAGGSSIDEGVFLGLCSAVLPKMHVGAWATVGAAAIVRRKVLPNMTVVGDPARPITEYRTHYSTEH
jgi:sugar O-acyltransferase (sialic acid O-acetyltransferase NeuD family)